MVELKVRKFRNSLGVVLPKEVINHLHTEDGQPILLVETSWKLSDYALRSDFREKDGTKAEDIDSLCRSTLHILAK